MSPADARVAAVLLALAALLVSVRAQTAAPFANATYAFAPTLPAMIDAGSSPTLSVSGFRTSRRSGGSAKAAAATALGDETAAAAVSTVASSSSPRPGTIAGAVVGSSLGAAGIAVAAVVIVRRRRRAVGPAASVGGTTAGRHSTTEPEAPAIPVERPLPRRPDSLSSDVDMCETVRFPITVAPRNTYIHFAPSSPSDDSLAESLDTSSTSGSSPSSHGHILSSSNSIRRKPVPQL